MSEGGGRGGNVSVAFALDLAFTLIKIEAAGEKAGHRGPGGSNRERPKNRMREDADLAPTFGLRQARLT